MAATNSTLQTDTNELNRVRTRDVYTRRKQQILDELQQNKVSHYVYC